MFSKLRLEEIFQEAKTDGVSKNISSKLYEAYMNKGVKIIKDSHSTRIETSGINYYQELSVEQYELFNKGWLFGVYTIALRKYQLHLERLDLKVRDEMNSSKSMKLLDGHKTHRHTLNKKHEDVSKKLHELTKNKTNNYEQ